MLRGHKSGRIRIRKLANTAVLLLVTALVMKHIFAITDQ